MGSRGALGEPATVLSPSLVTSVAHPCPPSSHKDGQHGLRHGWELGEAWMDLGGGGGLGRGGPCKPCKRGYAGTGCCSTPGAWPQLAHKHHCVLGEPQGWAGGIPNFPLWDPPPNANTSAPPACRGKGEKQTPPAGCELLRRVSKPPQQLPRSARRPRNPLPTNTTAPPYQKHPPPPDTDTCKATTTTHPTARRHDEAVPEPVWCPPPCPQAPQAPRKAPSAGAACCAPCPTDGRLCWGVVSPRVPPRHAQTLHPQDRGSHPAAPAPPSSL